MLEDHEILQNNSADHEIEIFSSIFDYFYKKYVLKLKILDFE
jgi:hypothetical protein